MIAWVLRCGGQWGAVGLNREESIYKKKKEALSCDKYVHYFDCDGDFTSIFTCQSLSGYAI